MKVLFIFVGGCLVYCFQLCQLNTGLIVMPKMIWIVDLLADILMYQ